MNDAGDTCPAKCRLHGRTCRHRAREGDGDDHLVGRSSGDNSTFMDGGGGDDFLLGVDDIGQMRGGGGDDRIFARAGNDGFVVGQAGDDYVDGGTGNDFIDGGIGVDILVSGAGSDIINPDVEFFHPNQPKDGARDVIRVTAADLGDFTDVVLSRAFETGLDEVRFKDAVRGGTAHRLYYEAQSINEATGRPYRLRVRLDLRAGPVDRDAG